MTDSEDSEYEKRRRRETIKNRSNNNTDKQRKDDGEPLEQSVWGNRMPSEVLHKVKYNYIVILKIVT